MFNNGMRMTKSESQIKTCLDLTRAHFVPSADIRPLFHATLFVYIISIYLDVAF